MNTELKDKIGPSDPTRPLSCWRATLDKGEDEDTITKEFARSSTFRTRLMQLLVKEYEQYAAKELDISAPDFAVQAAFSAGAKKALQAVYRMINVTTDTKVTNA